MISTLPKETPSDYAKLSEALHRPEALNLVRNQIPARSTPHYGPLCITPGTPIGRRIDLEYPFDMWSIHFTASSARKSVCTLVRQLRGPHLSTWA